MWRSTCASTRAGLGAQVRPDRSAARASQAGTYRFTIGAAYCGSIRKIASSQIRELEPARIVDGRTRRGLPQARHLSSSARAQCAYVLEPDAPLRQHSCMMCRAVSRFAAVLLRMQLVARRCCRQVRAAQRFTRCHRDADADACQFGDELATLRRALHRAQLPYALGVSSTLTVFLGTPTLVAPLPRAGTGVRARARRSRPRSRPSRHAPGPRASPHARGAWCRGATAPNPPGGPASAPRASPPLTTGATVVWRQRSGSSASARSGRATAPSTYLVHLPATASLRTVVRLTHQRWRSSSSTRS